MRWYVWQLVVTGRVERCKGIMSLMRYQSETNVKFEDILGRILEALIYRKCYLTHF